MKGFPCDSALHAFALEPRIVFDGSTAADTTDAADSSTDSSSTETTVVSTSDDSTTENSSPTVSSEQDTITAESSATNSFYDFHNYSYITSNIDDLVLSSDGDYAYAVNYTTSVISVFSVAEDGTLSLVQSIHTSDLSDSVSSGVSLIEFSADESEVYIYSETNDSLLTFSVDSTSGELTYESSTDLSTVIGSDALTDIQENNGYLYVTAGDSVYVLQSSDDGLTLVDTETEGENDVEGISGNNTLTFSGDGNTLFVSSSEGDDAIVSVFTVNDDGSITYTGSVTGSGSYYINSLVANEDGTLVYALQKGTDSTEVITMAMNTDTGEYEVIDTETVDDDTTQLVLSSDESALFTFGTSVISYDIDSDGSLGESTTMDSSSASISSGVTTVAYASSSDEIIAVTADSISVYSYTTASVDYTEGDDAVAILPNGVISDTELDAADDYNGATITISRDDTTDTTGDTYTFLEENGLTLEDGVIYLDGESIATWNADESGVTVTFTASVSQATAQLVLRQIAYKNTSDDPDAAGDSVTLDVVLDDGSGATSTLNVTLNLTDVNDAPVLSGDDNTVDYTSGDDYVTIFSDATIDTVESGDTVWKLSITIDGASETDTLNVDGNIITLTTTSGAAQTVNGLSYQVTESDGVITVIVFVSTTADSAESIIDNIQYRTTTEDSSGEVTFNLSVIESDGSSSEATLNSTINVTAQTDTNQATEISSTSTSIDYEENSGANTVLSDTIISDAEIDARNDGEGNYDGVSITITTDNSETEGELTISSNDTYTYESQQILKDGVVIATVESTDDGLVITFTEEYEAIPTTEDVNAILSLITYTNDSDALPDSSTVSLTVTDSFGNQSDTFVVAINFTNENDDPEASLGELYTTGVLSAITSVSDLEELSDITDTVISDSGDYLFVSDSSGNVAVYSVNADTGAMTFLSVTEVDSSASIDQILTNEDGTELVVIQSLEDDYGYTYSEVTVYSVDTNGELAVITEVGLTSTSYAVYQAMSNFTLSDDGSVLFFTSSNNLFMLDIDSGSVTTYGSAWSEPYLYNPTALTISGDYLFVTTSFSSATLIAYQITDDGIEWVGYIRNGSSDSDGNTVSISSSIIDLEASEDGSTIYASTSAGITIYTFDSSTDSFSAGTTIELSNIVDTALSADGSILYVTTSDSQLIRYSIGDDGSLTQIDSTDIDSDSSVIDVTDGGAILVGGANFTYYQVVDYTLDVEVGGSTTLMPIISVSDADTVLTDSYQDFIFTLSASGTTLSSDNISVDSDSGYTAENGVISVNGEAVAIYEFTAEGSVVLTVTATLSESEVNDLLQSIQYTASDDAAVGDSITFTLTMDDSSGAASTNTWTVDVVAKIEAPEVDLGDYELDSGETHESYSVTLPDDIVSDPAQLELTWSVDGLPDGMTFDADTQTLSGTPTTAGDYTLTFTVTNSSGKSSTFALSLSIDLSDADSVPDVQIDDPSVTVEPDETFTYQFATDDVTDPQDLDLTWTASNLPDGVTFDAETLTLSGEATETGIYDITITVENSEGYSTSFTFTLSVATAESSQSDSGATINDNHDFLTERDNQEKAQLQQERIQSEVVTPEMTTLIEVADTVVTDVVNDTIAALNTAQQTTQWLQELQSNQDETDPQVTTVSESGEEVSIDLDELTQIKGERVVNIVQQNGDPLPDGVSFDAQTGKLTVSAEALKQMDSDVVTITVQDSQGHRHQVKVDLSEASDKHASIEIDQSLEQQALQTSQQAIQLTNQLWLAELIDA